MLNEDDARAPQQQAEQIVDHMVSRDLFSKWLGIEVISVAPRAVTCAMTVREEMVNGFGVAHGGIVFSLADSAFAFACNTHGRVTVAINNSITYPAAVNVGDQLTARAEESAASSRLGYYDVTVRNQHGTTVALFRGTAYATRQLHSLD